MSIDFKNNIKKSERRHLTTSYLPEVTDQNHVLDSFSKNKVSISKQKSTFSFAFKFDGP